jgi:hypothetical protein
MIRGRRLTMHDRPLRYRPAPRVAATARGDRSRKRRQMAARCAIGPRPWTPCNGRDERGQRPRQHRKDDPAQIAQAQPRVAQRSRSRKGQRQGHSGTTKGGRTFPQVSQRLSRAILSRSAPSKDVSRSRSVGSQRCLRRSRRSWRLASSAPPDNPSCSHSRRAPESP